MKTSTLIRRFLPYFKKYRGMLFLDLVCAALTTVCDLVLPLIVRDVTDLAANNLSALTVSFVLRVGGIYVLLRIVDALANFYMASRGHIMGTFIERIRCGGMGLGGVLTKTGIGTVVEKGKQVIEVKAPFNHCLHKKREYQHEDLRTFFELCKNPHRKLRGQFIRPHD